MERVAHASKGSPVFEVVIDTISVIRDKAAFRARADSGARLFFPNDGHPNETGYRAIAEEVAAHIPRTNTLGSSNCGAHETQQLLLR